jgi:hypothetical protein
MFSYYIYLNLIDISFFHNIKIKNLITIYIINKTNKQLSLY